MSVKASDAARREVQPGRRSSTRREATETVRTQHSTETREGVSAAGQGEQVAPWCSSRLQVREPRPSPPSLTSSVTQVA